MGYLAFIMFGPLAATITSLFYQHIEVFRHTAYKGSTTLLAWLHLILMNVGVVGATFIMMNGGYRGGALTISLQTANPTMPLGQILGQVHVQVLSGLPPYIAAFTLVAILGALAGGIGFAIMWRRSMKSTT